MTSPAVGSWLGLRYQMWIPCSCTALKSNETALWFTSQDRSAVTAPVGIACCAGHCCGSEVLQLSTTIDCFFPWAACIAPSANNKASPRGGGFQISSSLVPPSTISKVCGVLSNRILLPSRSQRPPRATAMALIVWGVSWVQMTHKLKGSVLVSLWLLGGAL